MGKKECSTKLKNFTCYGTTTEVTSLEITVDQATGDIYIANIQPGTIKVAMEYERNSGKNKTTVVVPTNKPNCLKSVTDIVLTSYEYIFAVDTNKISYKNDIICVTSVYYVPQRVSTYTATIPFSHHTSFIIKNPRQNINAETIGWHIFFDNILKNSSIANSEKMIGVIVDSELGNHQQINQRKLPYYRENYIHKNVCFIYASADTAPDSLPNALINLCDKNSTMVLNKIIEEKRTIPVQSTGDDNYEGFTKVRPLGDQTKASVRKFNFPRKL